MFRFLAVFKIKANSILLLLCLLCLQVSLDAKGNITIDKKVFTFTAIPDQDAVYLQKRFKKFAEYLSLKLNMTVEYIPVKSYSAAITAFRNNQVQLAWFGGLSGLRARSLVKNSEAIAQGFEDQFFETYFIAHHSTGLKKSKDFPKGIRGYNFTFGSKGSTSGRLMPEYYIRKELGVPMKVFTKVGYSGDHTKTIALVQAGSYKLGAVNYKVWESLKAQGKIDLKKISIIWKTPKYQDYQWSIRGDVDKNYGEKTIAKVKKVLLDIRDEALLKSFPRSSFVAAKNSDYDNLKKTAKFIGLMD